MWILRIYFAGKQRHVGRYEDEGEAAKAYDKAAVFLYGAGAVTNFGLVACLEDPTEVSDFIVQAKANSHLKVQQPPPQTPHLFGAMSAAQQLQQAHQAPGAAVAGRLELAAAAHTSQLPMYAAQPMHKQLQQQQQQQLVLPVGTVGNQPQQLLPAAGRSPISWDARTAPSGTPNLLLLQQQQQQQQHMLVTIEQADSLLLPLATASTFLAAAVSNASSMQAANLLSSSDSLPSSAGGYASRPCGYASSAGSNSLLHLPSSAGGYASSAGSAGGYLLSSTPSGLSDAWLEASAALPVTNTCSAALLLQQQQQQQQHKVCSTSCSSSAFVCWAATAARADDTSCQAACCA
uniref:AP2/ERF domain-containing protein n=1 Tax=Tetradesmus obliquus TaxID=3088 RepID=A0A383WET2_TETOB|eukprot:jgi/Sobl393_1/15095/SZX67717.1